MVMVCLSDSTVSESVGWKKNGFFEANRATNYLKSFPVDLNIGERSGRWLILGPQKCNKRMKKSLKLREESGPQAFSSIVIRAVNTTMRYRSGCGVNSTTQ